jgi:hypothetical protein
MKPITVLMAALIATTTTAVFAASPHYKKGGKPVCTIDAGTGAATCSTGEVAGLGNEDVLIVVTVSGSAGTFCHNPGNTNIVPGQNPAEGSSTGTQLIDADEIKNGTLVIDPISTDAVTFTAPSSEEAGCPNPQWTVTVDTSNVEFSGFYSFQQPPGTQINKLSFAF